MEEVIVLLSGDKHCHIQVVHNYVYAMVITKNVNVSCLLIVNSDRHLAKDLEDIIVPVNGEEDFCILKSLDIHEMILRAQESELEVSHEDTSALQYLNLPFIVDHFIVNGYLMGFFQGGTNYVH